jgi:peptidoglycan/LPS O-acetylase OafA/YrhL
VGLAGPTLPAKIFSWGPLVAIGSSTYCLYLLHFNTYILIHVHHLPERLHVERFDPWISYVAVVAFAMLVRKYVEHPGQKLVSGWWKRKRQGSGIREQGSGKPLPVAKSDPVAP